MPEFRETWSYDVVRQQEIDRARMWEAIGRRQAADRSYLETLQREPPPVPERERLVGNDTQNVEAGDGGVHVHVQNMRSGDDRTQVEGPNASLHLGQVEERERASDLQQYGIRARATMGGVQREDRETTTDTGVGIGLNTPSAGFEATVGQRGAFLGLGAGVLDAAGHVELESLGDTDIQYGVGLGAGAGGGLLWGDDDGDGCPEVGVQISAGPFSGGIRTEGTCTPLRPERRD